MGSTLEAKPVAVDIWLKCHMSTRPLQADTIKSCPEPGRRSFKGTVAHHWRRRWNFSAGRSDVGSPVDIQGNATSHETPSEETLEFLSLQMGVIRIATSSQNGFGVFYDSFHEKPNWQQWISCDVQYSKSTLQAIQEEQNIVNLESHLHVVSFIEKCSTYKTRLIHLEFNRSYLLHWQSAPKTHSGDLTLWSPRPRSNWININQMPCI